MLSSRYVTWIIAADAERCRGLEERRRGGELSERLLWVRAPGEPAHGGKFVAQQRFGYGQAVVNERDLHALAERRFLAGCAEALDLAAVRQEYEWLVLLAAPHALGVLRDELSRATRRLIEFTAPCDCVREPAEKLRLRLRALRAPH